MSLIIEKYYKEKQIMPLLLKKKMLIFEKHLDIAAEFENWIKTGEYVVDKCINVEGYTAESLAKLSPFIDGEQAFVLLAELRDEPQKAMDRINRGFKLK